MAFSSSRKGQGQKLPGVLARAQSRVKACSVTASRVLRESTVPTRIAKGSGCSSLIRPDHGLFPLALPLRHALKQGLSSFLGSGDSQGCCHLPWQSCSFSFSASSPALQLPSSIFTPAPPTACPRRMESPGPGSPIRSLGSRASGSLPSRPANPARRSRTERAAHSR